VNAADAHRQARALLDANRQNDALRILFAALAESPDDADALRLVGQVYLRSEVDRETDRAAGHDALVALKQSLVLEPEHAQGWSLLAIAYLRVGMLGDARVAARRGQRLAPDDWSTHYSVAIVDAAASYVTRETRAALTEAMRLAPEEPGVHFAAARVADARNRPRAAARSYEKVLSLDPQHAAARNNLAVLHVRRGNTGRAAAGFVGILASDPGAIRALSNLRYAVRRALRLVNLLLWAAVGIVNIELTDSSKPIWGAVTVAEILAAVAIVGTGGYVLWVRLSAGVYFGRLVRGIPRTDGWLAAWSIVLVASLVALVVAASVPLAATRVIYQCLAPLLFFTLVIFFTVSLVRKTPGER
jgi:tetratricopeptide (TPR) repeat protein